MYLVMGHMFRFIYLEGDSLLQGYLPWPWSSVGLRKTLLKLKQNKINLLFYHMFRQTDLKGNHFDIASTCIEA